MALKKLKMTNEDKLRVLEIIITNLSPLSNVFHDVSEILKESIAPDSKGQLYIEDEQSREKLNALANQSLDNIEKLVSALLANQENPDVSQEEFQFLIGFIDNVLGPFMKGNSMCILLLGPRTERISDESATVQEMTSYFIEGTQHLGEMIDFLTIDID